VAQAANDNGGGQGLDDEPLLNRGEQEREGGRAEGRGEGGEGEGLVGAGAVGGAGDKCGWYTAFVGVGLVLVGVASSTYKGVSGRSET